MITLAMTISVSESRQHAEGDLDPWRWCWKSQRRLRGHPASQGSLCPFKEGIPS